MYFISMIYFDMVTHARILSYIEYGFTNWSINTKSTMVRVESLYKIVLKIEIKKQNKGASGYGVKGNGRAEQAPPPIL